MSRQPGPDFLFVGPSKSGSSWIFEVLRSHPQVFVPVAKDIYFFLRHYDRGPAWYEAFFKARQPDQIAGEVCHDYFASPTAMERIAEYRPDTKLICCLRNPFERAVSSYQFFQRNGLDLGSLALQAERHPVIFDEGFYATHLRRIYAAFPKESVLPLVFDDLAADPRGFARSLFEFLGVDHKHETTLLDKKVNAAAAPRAMWVARAVKIGAEQARTMGLSNLVGAVKRNQVVQQALYKPRPDDDRDWTEMLDEFPEDIVTRFRREIDETEDMLGRRLDAWRPLEPVA